ncbi:MAG TPA: chemotaxis response regulator protein-glutamate methylesterase [Casimicrobiaceae bacterium]
MIKVLIVDDSAVVRQVISGVLSQDRSIHVIAAVADPIFAMQRMQLDWPDVIVLDVEMPRMDGITFLKKVMAERPTPVVICSSLTVRGAGATMQALAAGAVAIVAKPKIAVRNFLLDASAQLLEAVKAAAQANARNLRPDVPAPVARPARAINGSTERVVAIGTSTGGTQALEMVLSALPRTSPPIVVVQHMPERFTTAFSERLNTICQIEVKEAQDNDRVLPGCALIAPGGKQMTLRRSGPSLYVDVRSAPPVNRHCPSVDVLFRSVAKCAGSNALGIIMTGMGSDGARGLLQMHQAGARTVAQDEDTCVVFGMPKEAIKLGAVDRILPVHSIPGEILQG